MAVVCFFVRPLPPQSNIAFLCIFPGILILSWLPTRYVFCLWLESCLCWCPSNACLLPVFGRNVVFLVWSCFAKRKHQKQKEQKNIPKHSPAVVMSFQMRPKKILNWSTRTTNIRCTQATDGQQSLHRVCLWEILGKLHCLPHHKTSISLEVECIQTQ